MKASINRSTLWMGLTILGMSALHLCFVNAARFVGDAAVLSNFCANGRITFWDGIFPANTISYMYGFAMVPIQTLIFSAVQNALGIGVWQMYVFPIVMGGVSLFLFVWFLRSLRLPQENVWILLSCGWSYTYFNSLHIVRMEPLILTILLLNLIWVSVRGGVWWGALNGFLFALTFGMHPNAIFSILPLMAFALFKEKKRDLVSSRRYQLWFLGSLVGMLTILYYLQIEPLMISFGMVHGKVYSTPRILRFFSDPMLSVTYFLDLLNPRYLPRPWFQPLSGAMLTSLVWELRRFRKISDANKSIVIIVVALLLSFLVCPSITLAYQIYLYPWLVLVLGMVVVQLLKKDMVLDPIDISLYGFMNMMMFAAATCPSLHIYLFPLYVRLALFGINKRNSWKIMLLMVLACGGLFFSDFPLVYGQLAHVFRGNILLALFCLVGPWFITARFPFGKIIPVLFCSWYLVNYISEVKLIRKEINETRLEGLISLAQELQRNKKIIGPPELWLIDQTLDFRGVDALTCAHVFLGPQFNPIPNILMFKPSIVLWPEKNLIALREYVAKKEGRKVQLMVGEKVIFVPSGKHRAIEIQEL